MGSFVADKNFRLAAVLKGVNELNFGDFEDNQIDLYSCDMDNLINKIQSLSFAQLFFICLEVKAFHQEKTE